MNISFKMIVMFFLIPPVAVSAQTADFEFGNQASIEFGPEDKLEDDLLNIFASDERGFYTVMRKSSLIDLRAWVGQNQYLARFNKAMDLEQVGEYDLKIDGNDLIIERLFMQNDILHLFTSYMDKKEKVRNAFYQTIDKETMVPNNDIRKIAEVGGDSKSEVRSTDFEIFRSKDEEITMVYYDIPSTEGDNVWFGVHVFDDQMNTKWVKEIELPFVQENFNIKTKVVAENGDVYVLGALWKDKKDREKGKVNYKYVVIELTDGGTKLKQYEIELEDKYVTTMFLRLNDQNELICGGFYMLSGSYGPSGTLFVKINRNSGVIAHQRFSKFDELFVKADMDKSMKKKADKMFEKGEPVGISNLEIDDLLLMDNGGAVIIGESRSESSISKTDGNGSYVTTYKYTNNEIVILNLDLEGNIKWSVKIPKEQVSDSEMYSSRRAYSSFVLAQNGSDLLFVFNDNPENLLYTGDGEIALLNNVNNYIAWTSIDIDGHISRGNMIDGQVGETMVKIEVSKQLANGDIMLFTSNGKKKQFMRVKLKN